MRSDDDESTNKAATPKEEMRATNPAVSPPGSLSQPVVPDTAATPASQPPPPSAAGPREEQPPKSRRRRSIGPRSSSSIVTRLSSARSSISLPSDNGAAQTSTDTGGRRRRRQSGEHDVANTPVRPQGGHQDEPQMPNVLGPAMPGGAHVDSDAPSNKPAQEAEPREPTASAPSESVVALETTAQGLPDLGESRLEMMSVVSALSRPVLKRGTKLVTMAATAVDVPGVVANIRAAAPHAAVPASSSMDTRGPDLIQDFGKVPSSVPSHTQRVPVKECALPQFIMVAAALCLLCAIVVLFVFVVLPLLERRPARKEVCDTRDCVLHANALRLARGQTATDACDDFGLLVCSTWTNKHRGLAWSVVSQAVMDWVVHIEESVAAVGHADDVIKRPMHLVHWCLHRQGSDEDAIMSLIHFVHNKSFAWPTDNNDNWSPSYFKALLALIELAVRWALPLWFRVDLLPSRAARNRTLTLKPSTIPIIWHYLHQEILSNHDVYTYYVYLFDEKFFAHRKPSPTYQVFLHESAVIQGHVLGNLSEANGEPIFVPKSVELKQLPSLVAHLKVDDWVNALQSAFNVSPPIEVHDVLLATNGEILAAVSRLFGVYDARSILYHTSWWFLQIVGVFTSNAVFNSANAHKLGTQFQKTVCAVHIEATDYPLLAAVSQTKFSDEQRRSIKRYLKHVHSTAVEKVRTSMRVPSPIRETLLSLLQRTTAVTWPEDAFASENSLISSYTQHLSAYNNSNMFALWSSLRVALQRSIGTEYHTADAKLPRLDTKTLTWYDPLLDAIAVSFRTLTPPLYYGSGTHAMLYGGLGYIYAREVVQAINVLARLLEEGGDVNGPSKSTVRVTLANNMCPGVELSETKLMFPSLPALEIAHAAYVTYRDRENDLPLKGLEKYSAEQVFFLTFCLTTCEVELSGLRSSSFCNSAVKNFEPFARAFSCRPGSKMNRGQKCRYFDV